MTLFLLPNLLGPVRDHHFFLPESVDKAVAQIDGLIAESEGEGRRYLKRFATRKKPHEMPIALLTKKFQELDFLLEPLLKKETWGVISDCGLPCLADPGAALVMRAHQLNIPIVAFTGPSSIIQALMLSGLSGQNFFFHGYLPKQPGERSKTLRQWEKIKHTTHLFIEAPYRNMHTFQACLETLHGNTLLCVAASLTLPDQWVRTLPLSIWKNDPLPGLGKKPTIFLFTSS
jgi:16S rRNA (cytidine1402-2'-O)-methyltransferase